MGVEALSVEECKSIETGDTDSRDLIVGLAEGRNWEASGSLWIVAAHAVLAGPSNAHF